MDSSTTFRRQARRSQAIAISGLVTLLIAGAGCGSSSAGHSGATKSAALTAAQLKNVVVEPPRPYVHVPDREKGTGLMEVGNPRAGTIGSPLGTKDQLVSTGFQRGWESLYRTPGAADVVQLDVFEFRTSHGASQAIDRFRAHQAAGYQSFTVADLPNSAGQSGVSPEGRHVVAIAFTDGRFAISLLAGGTRAGYDYRAFAVDLAEKPRSHLPST